MHSIWMDAFQSVWIMFRSVTKNSDQFEMEMIQFTDLCPMRGACTEQEQCVLGERQIYLDDKAAIAEELLKGE